MELKMYDKTGIIQSRFVDIRKLDWIIPDVPFYRVEYLFKIIPCVYKIE